MLKCSGSGRSVNLLTLFQYGIVIPITLFVFVVGGSGVGYAGQLIKKEKLLQSARAKGKVRVIVRFDDTEETTTTGGSQQSGSSDSARSDRIKKRADKFLARLQAAHYKINARPKHIPFVALSVNENALARLEALQEVLTVVEDLPVPPPVPTEPPAALPPDSANVPGSDAQIGAESSWAAGYSGSGWYIAVLDTGIRSSHEMFTDKTIVEHCFSTNDSITGASSACPGGSTESDDPGSAAPVASRYASYDHGTHIAGIAVGDAPDVKGVAVDADIIAVQVFSRFDNSSYCGGGDCVLSYISDQTRALDWIYDMRQSYPIAAVNLSLGTGYYTDYCDNDSRKAAIENLKSAGIAVTISTGNGYHCDGIGAPACVSSSIAVGALDENDTMADFSNWIDNGMVDLFAPGELIYSAVASGDTDYQAWNGTSLAASFAAGSWAILKQKRPDGSVDDLLNAIQSTAATITVPCNWSSVDQRLHLDLALQELNRSPAADAGADQTVAVGDSVFLDGSNSFDPDENDMLIYEWSGPADITLSDNTVPNPQFTAPDVGVAQRIITLQLSVRDNHDSMSTNTVDVTVDDPPPIADAGSNQTVAEDAAVTLDGSDSYDQGGSAGPILFLWSQTGGPEVSLANANTSMASFIAPQVGSGSDVLTFRLEVTDSAGHKVPDYCTVTVSNSNQPPVADAGPDQHINEGIIVNLDGSGSIDPDGAADIATFQWTQTGGPGVSLDNAAIATATFTAPMVGSAGETLFFDLTVTDKSGQKDTNSCTVTVNNLNQSPVADAGADQQIGESLTVTLDGSDSTDPDGPIDISAYQWVQTGGPGVSINMPTEASATFTAPAVGPSGAVLSFELSVTDMAGEKGTDTCTVTVNNLNQSPVPNAGVDQQVGEGLTVTLDGSGSTDPDGPIDISTYQWVQTGGPAVSINMPTEASATFTAPVVGPSGAVLSFELSVIDQAGEKGTDTCTVTVNNLNQSPVPNAGVDQQVGEGLTVTLDGSSSTDPDGPTDISTYAWVQTGGPSVSILNASDTVASFTAPFVTAGGDVLYFKLTVTDQYGQNASDTCEINVLNINQPPVADAGGNQNTIGGTLAILNGSASSDPDGGSDISSFQWTQTSGKNVSLNNANSAVATFSTPSVGPAGENLVFELTVTDSGGATSRSSCTVSVTNTENAPTARAGNDQQVSEGVSVTLDGSASTDPEGQGDIVSYRWIQTGGKTVALENSDQSVADFLAPAVGPDGENLSFTLTITDRSGFTHTDSCAISVINVNQSPIADAGADQITAEGTTVTLYGGHSSDPDADILQYQWLQLDGEPVVTLSHSEVSNPTFVCTLPAGVTHQILKFQLTVIDPFGSQAMDEVNVVIEDNQIIDFPDAAATTSTTGGAVGVMTEEQSQLVRLDLVDPDQLPAPSGKSKEYPYGMLELAVKVPVPGMATDVTVHFEEPLPKKTVWMKYNPKKGWEDYTGKVVFKNNNTIAVIHLVDGGAGDDDGLANGIIIDPSGPGISIIPDSPDGGSGSGGGCFITTAVGP